MNRWLISVVIVVSITIGCALPGYCAVCGATRVTDHRIGVAALEQIGSALYAPQSPRAAKMFLHVAKDNDLDHSASAKTSGPQALDGAQASLASDVNGNGEDEDADEGDEGEGRGDEEKGGDEGGWDRAWDAPKLG